METTLHRQLKLLYGREERHEQWVDGYRIDVIQARTGRLVEIQSASLAALRPKVRTLLDAGHRLLIVKPLAARKYIIKRAAGDSDAAVCRASPHRETLFDIFTELVHFVPLFPRPGLTLELLLTEQEEIRIPRQTRRRKRFQVEDRLLRNVQARHTLRTVADLRRMLPEGLPREFTTAELATTAGIPRWLAQKMAYCLRTAGAVRHIGKRGHAQLYAHRG